MTRSTKRKEREGSNESPSPSAPSTKKVKPTRASGASARRKTTVVHDGETDSDEPRAEDESGEDDEAGEYEEPAEDDGDDGEDDDSEDFIPATKPKQASSKKVPKKPAKKTPAEATNESSSATKEAEYKRTSAVNKKARRKRDAPKTIEDANALAKNEKAFREEAALYLQMNDVTLANTIKIARALNEVKSMNYTRPTPSSRGESRLNAILATDPIEGRKLKLHSVTRYNSSNEWRIRVEDIGESKFLAVKSKAVMVPFSVVRSSDSTNARKVGEELIRILNGWPFPFFANDGQATHVIRALALANVMPTFGTNIRELTVSKTYGYGQPIRHFDPETGAALQFEFTVMPLDEKMAGVAVPALPSSLSVSSGKDVLVQKDSQGRFPYRDWIERGNNKKPSSIRSQHVAQDLLRYVAMQCEGMVASKARMSALVSYWQSICNYSPYGRAKFGAGIYSDRPLYSVYQEKVAGSSFIQPSAAVGDDLNMVRSLKRLRIRVHSPIASRVTPCLDAVIETYIATGDIRRGIIQAAKVADQVNRDIAEGLPPSSACDCMDDMTATVLHPCEGCTKETLCRTRSFDTMGRLVCSQCIDKEKRAAEVSVSKPQTAVQATIGQSFSRNFRIECKKRGIDPKLAKNKKVEKAALEELAKRVPIGKKATVYADAYLGREVEMPVEISNPSLNPSRRRIHPHRPTVDAVFPRTISEDGRFFAHAKGNVVTTSLPPQYAKWISLPGYLQELAKFANIDNPTDCQKKEFLYALEGLHEARSRFAISNKARMADEPSQENHTRDLNEWRSGKTGSGDEWKGKANLHKYTQRTIPPTTKYIWDQPTRTRLAKLAKQIAKKFGKELVISVVDGAPWIGPQSTMPEDWSWNSWAVMCQERLERMRTTCNSKWETRDTAQGLYAEILWQCYSDDRNYGDRMRLPLVLWFRHPLRLSVAHKHHGFGMFSGWPPEPSDISERDDAANNMLIESWTTNAVKWDMDETYYDLAFDMLKEIKVPTEYYDPNLPAPPEADLAFAKLSDTDTIFDEYAGPGFDEDQIESEDSDNSGAGEGEGIISAVGAADIEMVDPYARIRELEGRQEDVQDDHVASEIAALSADAQELRRRAVQDFPGATTQDPDIMSHLVVLQQYAQIGDRNSYMAALIPLMEKFDSLEGLE